MEVSVCEAGGLENAEADKASLKVVERKEK